MYIPVHVTQVSFQQQDKIINITDSKQIYEIVLNIQATNFQLQNCILINSLMFAEQLGGLQSKREQEHIYS